MFHTICCEQALVFGAFTLGLPPVIVAKANTLLTAGFAVGFFLLSYNFVAYGDVDASRLSRSDWSSLKPDLDAIGSWSLPLVLSVLQYGSAVPVVVQGMRTSDDIGNAWRARKALVVGAAIPLTLNLMWAAVTCAQPPSEDSGNLECSSDLLGCERSVNFFL